MRVEEWEGDKLQVEEQEVQVSEEAVWEVEESWWRWRNERASGDPR